MGAKVPHAQAGGALVAILVSAPFSVKRNQPSLGESQLYRPLLVETVLHRSEIVVCE